MTCCRCRRQIVMTGDSNCLSRVVYPLLSRKYGNLTDGLRRLLGDDDLIPTDSGDHVSIQ